MKKLHFLSFLLLFIMIPVLTGSVQEKKTKSAAHITSNDYDKYEYRISMRDGVHLFTSVYIPKDRSRTYPILLTRTPYSVGPYGKRKKNQTGTFRFVYAG